MRHSILFTVALAVGTTGCSTFTVKKAKPTGDFHGIPFYVKTAGCKHQIVRLEPYYVLTLTTKDGDKLVSTETTTLSRIQFNSKEVVELRSLVAGKGGASGPDIRALWDIVRAQHYEPHMPESQVSSDNWFIVSDNVSAYTFVDYEHPYTFNARRPIIGSVQASAKLGEDGTLSEGTGQAEDKTLSTLFSLVPTTALIKSAAGIVGFDGGALTIELSTEEKGVKYTRTYWLDQTFPPCAVAQARREETNKPYDLIIEDVGAEKKSPDENTIKVNGAIQLPKPKDSKSKDQK